MNEPRRKNCNSKKGKSMPIPVKPKDGSEVHDSENWNIAIGQLNDRSIHIDDLDDMKNLYVNGFYGKGLRSKGAPQTLIHFAGDEYAFLKREKTGKGKKSQQMSSNSSEYTNLEFEPLVLSLCEAYFLSYAYGCLVVKTESGEMMGLRKMWNLFRELDSEFLFQYVGYHHFRSKGWVVRSGLNYGVDFVLYKEGPPFYHSSYCVHVVPVTRNEWDAELDRPSVPKKLREQCLLVRITEGVAKELLLLYVIYPKTTDEHFFETPKCIPELIVKEVRIRRADLNKLKEDKK